MHPARGHVPVLSAAAVVVLAGVAACGGNDATDAPGDEARDAVRAVPAPPPAVLRRQAPPATPPPDDHGLPPQVPVRATEAARAADVRVIRRWLAAQRAGDLARAARSWRLPARYQRRSAVIIVDQPSARDALVASFRCRTHLASAGGAGAFVVVSLRVAARPGVRCRARPGNVGRAAIRIGYGRIAEYYGLPADPRTEPRRQRPHPAPVGVGVAGGAA